MAATDLDMSQLKQDLVEKEDNLMTAVKFGKALLEENIELKEQIENVVKTYSKKVEAKEQELYSLQLKYEQKASLEQWYSEEMASLKKEMAAQRETIQEELEFEHHQETERLKKQTNHVQSELELSQNSERQLKEQVRQLEELMKEQINETANISKSFYSEELGQAQQEIMSLQNEKTGLKTQMIEMEMELKQAREERELLRSHLRGKDLEMEELQCQITSYSNNMERSRVEIMDLKAQMDALRMEANSHKSKGNSLFSEVEDRRVVAEKKLISMNVQIETLKEKYEMEKSQHHKLKMQMVMLLQMSGGQGDKETVTRLQSQLTDANAQIKQLSSKVEDLENMGHGSMDHMAEFRKVFSDGSKDDYVQYLHNLLKAKDKELTESGKELRVTNMLLLDEKNKVLQQRKELFSGEEEKAQLRGQNVKLYLQNEELLMKYDPDKLKSKKQGMVFKTEKIPLTESEDETEEERMKISECHGIQGLDASVLINRTANRSVLTENQSDNLRTRNPSSEETNGKIPGKSENLRTRNLSSEDKTEKNGKIPGSRSVSISDSVTVVSPEGGKEKMAIVDGKKGMKEEGKPKQIGRVVSNVKMSRAKPNDVNECKNQ